MCSGCSGSCTQVDTGQVTAPLINKTFMQGGWCLSRTQYGSLVLVSLLRPNELGWLWLDQVNSWPARFNMNCHGHGMKGELGAVLRMTIPEPGTIWDHFHWGRQYTWIPAVLGTNTWEKRKLYLQDWNTIPGKSHPQIHQGTYEPLSAAVPVKDEVPQKNRSQDSHSEVLNSDFY